MADNIPMNPLAPHDLPSFITAPGQTDTLLVVGGIILLLAVIGIGVFYLKIHSLPEQMAHRGQKVQFQVVAVLALLALFTHYHIFWVVALLLALVQLPDFSTPLGSMARSLNRMSGRDDVEPAPPQDLVEVAPRETAPAAVESPPPAPVKTGKRGA